MPAGDSRPRMHCLNTVAHSPGLAKVLDELADLKPVVDVEEMDRLSKDFAWFSPILVPQLKDKRGDAAFSPGFGRGNPAHRRRLRAPSRSAIGARRRDGQLRPAHAVAGRGDNQPAALQQGQLDPSGRCARAGRHPPGDAQPRGAGDRVGIADAALDVQDRLAGRILFRRYRRHRLDQLRRLRRARQCAGRRDHDPRRGTADHRIARGSHRAVAALLGHRGNRAGTGDRPGARATLG